MVVALWGSQVCPFLEVIQDGVEGILTPMNSPELLAEKVLQLLANPEVRARLEGLLASAPFFMINALLLISFQNC